MVIQQISFDSPSNMIEIRIFWPIAHLGKLDIEEDVELGEDLVVATRARIKTSTGERSTGAGQSKHELIHMATRWMLLAPDTDLAVDCEWRGSAGYEAGFHPTELPLLQARERRRKFY